MPGALTHDPITVGGGLHQTPSGGVQSGPDGLTRALTASQVAEVSSVLDGRRTNNSLLVVGGDHPYAQWWGTNGRDGMAQMYEDLGIRPYLATCADESTDGTSGAGLTVGRFEMITVDQAQALQQRGVEFVSHGTRHTNAWELFNTGIRVWYTGAENTPTVNISATQLTTSTATTGATNFLFSTYTTLAALAAAIEALAGWRCLLATELLGTEPSAALVPLNAARSVTYIGAGDLTNSNQRFAIASGLLLRYNGTAYRDISIACNSGSNFLLLYGDGARLIGQSTNATLLTISAAINALNIPGLTCLVMDNGYNAQTIAGSTVLNPGQKFRETYCFGDENGLTLTRVETARSINGFGVMLTQGLGHVYAVRRAILAAKERFSADYGLNVESFCQPGGRLAPWMLGSVLDEHVSWRGGRGLPSDLLSHFSPHAMPANLPTKFTGYFISIVSSSPITPYGEADVKAIIDAMADSDGWLVNWLNHLCTPTPGDPSPYTGMNQHPPATYTSSADQDEGPFWRELQYAAAARDAGKIDILPLTVAERTRATRRGPSNLIFNAKFRNGRADNLLGITTVPQGAFGIACPGVALSTAAADYSAVTVGADRGVTITTNGALGASKIPLAWNLFLEPGKTYQIGAFLDLMGLDAANYVRWILYPIDNTFGPDLAFAQGNIASEAYYGGQVHDALFRLSVPARGGPSPAQVVSKAGPFVFTAGDSITVKIDNLTASAPIVLTGLTTARAVAAAINTAIAADATYGPLGQYTNVARVENNRVVIEAPAVAALEDQSRLEVLNSAGTPLVPLFGAGVTSARASSRLHANIDAPIFGYRLGLTPSTTLATKTFRVLAPYCREVRI